MAVDPHLWDIGSSSCDAYGVFGAEDQLMWSATCWPCARTGHYDDGFSRDWPIPMPDGPVMLHPAAYRPLVWMPDVWRAAAAVRFRGR